MITPQAMGLSLPGFAAGGFALRALLLIQLAANFDPDAADLPMGSLGIRHWAARRRRSCAAWVCDNDFRPCRSGWGWP
jgi:hypothetical protein